MKKGFVRPNYHQKWMMSTMTILISLLAAVLTVSLVLIIERSDEDAKEEVNGSIQR